MNAIYGYIVVALLVAAIAGVVGYWQGGKHAATAAELAMAEHLAADRKAESDHKDKVRQLEQALAEAQADVSEAYEKGKKDAEATSAAVIANLRAGNLRLQQRWAGCETQRLSDAAALAAEPDATARDREESAGRIVRAAAECDAQVRGLQELLILEREQLNKR
ncbi:MAG: hypothetical protein KatS3mg015_2618 [Fimbriimonadales bacterium]|nr:MAG: hypothetical protein KatS3mg015_2618 [Fimbriimonadales bacterium]